MELETVINGWRSLAFIIAEDQFNSYKWLIFDFFYFEFNLNN